MFIHVSWWTLDIWIGLLLWMIQFFAVWGQCWLAIWPVVVQMSTWPIFKSGVWWISFFRVGLVFSIAVFMLKNNGEEGLEFA